MFLYILTNFKTRIYKVFINIVEFLYTVLYNYKLYCKAKAVYITKESESGKDISPNTDKSEVVKNSFVHEF